MKTHRHRSKLIWVATIFLTCGTCGWLFWPTLRVFLPAPHPPGYDELVAAIEAKDAKNVRTILKSGVNPNSFPDSDWAITNEEDITPLNLAAKVGGPEIVKLLLDAGASTSIGDGWNACPLQAAAAEGNVEVLKVLIGRGAAINDDGKGGSRALWSASMGSHREAVKLLLAYGANPNSLNGRDTLVKCLRDVNNDPIIIKLLKDAGGRG